MSHARWGIGTVPGDGQYIFFYAGQESPLLGGTSLANLRARFAQKIALAETFATVFLTEFCHVQAPQTPREVREEAGTMQLG